MNNSISIQEVGNEQSAPLVDLILSIQQFEFGIPITLEDQPDLLDIENFYRLPGGNFWAAFYEGKLVGSIALIKISESEGVIRKMFVNKEFRGKEYGLAQLLMNRLVEYCASVGITDIYLGTVDVLKAAIRFYERNGFEFLDKSELPATFPLMRNDNVFCHLSLK